ncbi:hypothetical protein CL176_00935 [Suicoccus acidiformans]|uniref:Uncharacterized protein n=1 Tax=Suicoccus acidiformans TaxID=2036206 RepID=A0A347WHZ9_9LACT|nr:hypothetical protein [Suicoccus acidiformans]AXY24706.1 hypothetical protein CL176_00935 [Suicoccus acidiformans]
MAIINQYDKRSGITYVYESISWWDSEKQRSRSKRKLIGKRDPETGEVVPTDGRNRKAKERLKQAHQERIQSISRKHYGATYLLQKIARKTGVLNDLKAIFPEHYQAYLNLAYYLVLAANSSMRHYES